MLAGKSLMINKIKEILNGKNTKLCLEIDFMFKIKYFRPWAFIIKIQRTNFI